MIAHLAALKARITAGPGYRTESGWSSSVTVPYVVLTGPSWDDGDEVAVCGPNDTLDAEVRIKAVAGTTDGVLTMLAAIRAELSPGSLRTALVVTGRYATVEFVRSEFVDIDDSVTITATNRHPAFGVDSYRIVSQPTT